MADTAAPTAAPPDPARRFGVGLARAVAGAVLFSLPLYMTMEMWELGATADPWRLTLLVLAMPPILVALSHVAGFESTFDLREDAVDAAVAWAVGIVTAAVGLLLLGVLRGGQPLEVLVGRVAVQAVPGSIGALLAQSQLGGQPDEQEERDRQGYVGELIVMGAGALFLAFNVAPTEEIELIAFRTTAWHVLALTGVCVVGVHAFVYAVEFRGQERRHPGTPVWSALLRYTMVGWALAVGISAWLLWTFGRLDDTGPLEALTTILVLAAPASIGAGAARLIL